MPPDPNAPPHVPPNLRSGQIAEARALDALHLAKNTAVWRPSPEQIESPAFRQIVGDPQFTPGGRVRGTVLDSVDGPLAEIKSGASPLNSTYQLRLQTYRSLVEERLLKIYTSRPIDRDFRTWLDPLGVRIEPLPGPQPQVPEP